MKRNGKTTEEVDRRPEPKPRKRPELWQSYLIWDELVEMRKRHTLRISSIDAGKSNMNQDIENRFLEAMQLDERIAQAKAFMIKAGKDNLPDVWDWVSSIKGLGAGGLAAQVLAQIDDITSFTNVSKLWRFSGFAVIDGEREYNVRGKKSTYNRKLKSICFLIVESFIKQQTPLYVDIYYQEKERLRQEHPEPVPCRDARDKSPFKMAYTDQHIHAMAMRKTAKIFLQHLWITWRNAEGLPTNAPYAIDRLGHADYIEPV